MVTMSSSRLSLKLFIKSRGAEQNIIFNIPYGGTKRGLETHNRSFAAAVQAEFFACRHKKLYRPI